MDIKLSLRIITRVVSFFFLLFFRCHEVHTRYLHDDDVSAVSVLGEGERKRKRRRVLK